MRDVVFLVADGGMVELLRGFFGRREFHRTLGCGRFDVDTDRDIVAAAGGHDSTVYRQAGELLRLYRATHQRAVVMLDSAWTGSPGPDKIREKISRSLRELWEEHETAVIVLDPELEVWLWQGDSPHVAAALGCPPDYRQILARSGHWPTDRAKPADPKAAHEYLYRRHGADKSRAVFRRLAGKISARGCTDPAFLTLRDTLRDWFPEETL